MIEFLVDLRAVFHCVDGKLLIKAMRKESKGRVDGEI